MLAGAGGRMAISREVVMPESIKHVRPKRFPVLIRGRWWPLLIPFAVTQERAFVQVGERELRVCFGPLFDYRFPLEAVETVAPSRWPLWAGIGPRVGGAQPPGPAPPACAYHPS